LKLGLDVLQRDYPGSEWTKKAQVYALIPWSHKKGRPRGDDM
jgi:hypothetical protein